MSSRSAPVWWNTFLLQLHRRRTSEPPAATVRQYWADVSRFGHGYSTSRALQTLSRGGGGGGKWGSSMKLPSVVVAAAAGYGPSGTPPPPPPRFNFFPVWYTHTHTGTVFPVQPVLHVKNLLSLVSLPKRYDNRARWLAGSVITLFLPAFWKAKWTELKLIEAEVEAVMVGVEHVAEVVEKVAEKAEKITANVAEKLPDDNKLKEAVLVVERFSKATANDAHLATDIIHKVEALKEDAEKLEALVEPIVEKIVHKEAESKGTTK